MPNWAIWILVAIVFGAIELSTVSFYSSLFGLGSLVAAVFSFINPSWSAQALVFIFASLLFVFFMRPILLKSYSKEARETNVQRLIGLSGLVIEPIDNTEGFGQVKVEGQVWTARSLTGEIIPVDSVIEIVRIDGVRAVVSLKEPFL